MTGENYDILIVGGGMVGASLACALAQAADTQARIAVVEATPATSGQQPSFDARSVALSWSSKVIFETLGLWEAIEARGVMPIERIHVSDRGHMGSTHMDCREQGVPALGYVVEARVIGEALNHYIKESNRIDRICPAQVMDFQAGDGLARVGIRQEAGEKSLQARLVVAADGGHSRLRELAGIRSLSLNYGQSALIANVVCDRPHRHMAFERFTDSGPMALLPAVAHDPQAKDRQYGLVWTATPETASALAELPEAEFLARLQARFGRRAGRFLRAGSRHVYPLKFLQAREPVRSRLAIIGNAAHSLHPVSGQGFNLGLRDAAVLAQVVVDALREDADPGSPDTLRAYARWRRRDQWQTALSTDSLVRIFSNGFPPLALARNFGLLALDVLPPLKRHFVRQAMGYIGKQPRLSRGLPL